MSSYVRMPLLCKEKFYGGEYGKSDQIAAIILLLNYSALVNPKTEQCRYTKYIFINCTQTFLHFLNMTDIQHNNTNEICSYTFLVQLPQYFCVLGHSKFWNNFRILSCFHSTVARAFLKEQIRTYM